MNLEDTIAAIATPPGTGGIGIIRVSGPKAEEVARTLFKPSKEQDIFASHRLYHGDIVAPASGAVLDEVLLTMMKKPSSYTGEDVLEIYCHGGYLILQTVLNEIIKSGCRPAMPGEFTKRAFLNNRIDLSQAEAVSDMIMAKTEKGVELALSHLKGNLSEIIHSLRNRIIAVLALLEASIDFTEDDMSHDVTATDANVADIISHVIHELQEVIATYDRGACVRNGINVVIAGRPNVGKSSLLNALLGQKRAIVTPLPGTTRDFIEEFINLEGIPVKLTDTAGIRAPENIIEKEGLELVRGKLSSADLIIILIDGSESLTDDDRDIIVANRTRKILLVANKNDLPQRLDSRELETFIPDVNILRISAKFGDGLSQLKGAILKAVVGSEANLSTTVTIANARHKCALERSVDCLSRGKEGYLKDLPVELVTIDIRDALSSLGEIICPTTDEDILNEIFSNFCIGK